MQIEPSYNGFPTTYAADTAAWRRWLKANGEKQANVWLVIFKKGSSIPSVTYDEAVDEALCWGWVDSKINKRDAESYYQFFAQRNPKSNWSSVNKKKIEKLLKEKRMQPAGLRMVELAKRTGTWTALDEIEQGIVPPDLEAKLKSIPKAFDYFMAFPKSVKRGILEWILNAKTPATRLKRIEETAALAAKNERANQYVPKQ